MTEKLTPHNISIGQEIPPFKVKIDPKKYRKYNRMIKEINPIHMSKIYAQNIGFDDIVVAGNFLFTYIPKWLLDWVGEVHSLKKISIKFENPVYPADIIVHKGKIIEIKKENGFISIQCEYHVEKENGEITSKGTVCLQL